MSVELLTCDACGVRTDEVAVMTVSAVSIEPHCEELVERKQYCIPCFGRLGQRLGQVLARIRERME